MSLEVRILSVLECFDLERRSLTVEEISAHTGLPQSSIYRSVRTLKEAGYIARDPEGNYTLTTKLLRFASIIRADNHLVALAQPALNSLAVMSRHVGLVRVM